MKRLLWGLVLACGLAFGASLPVVRGTITTQNLTPTATCTANSCVEYGIETAGSVTVQVTGTYTGALSIQVSTDGATWVTLGAATTVTRGTTGATSATIASGVQDVYQVSVAGYRRMRVTGLAAMTGTASIAIFGVETGGASVSGGGGGGGAVTVADGADVATGATADAVCATDTGTCSMIALMKKQNADITGSNPQLPTTIGQTNNAGSLSVALSTSQMTATANTDANRLAVSQPDSLVLTPASLTATGNLFSQDMTGYNGIAVQVTSAGSATITYECSADNATWVACFGRDVGGATTFQATMTSTTASIYVFPRMSKFFRARVSAYTSGTVTVVANLMLNPLSTALPVSGVVALTGQASVQGQTGHGTSISGNPLREGTRARTSNVTAVTNDQQVDSVGTLVGVPIVRPFSIPEGDWNFAPATGGISNSTTAVTVKTAAGAGIRNYVTGLCISTATLGGATEFAIRDGAAGTVIFRVTLPTVAAPMTCHTFNTPLAGTANTLLEIVTLTAVTGNVLANLQGYAAP